MTSLRRRVDDLARRIPARPDAERLMPREPRDLGEFSEWVRAGVGFHCRPGSPWLAIAESAKRKDCEGASND
jgi:hypothetical protein